MRKLLLSRFKNSFFLRNCFILLCFWPSLHNFAQKKFLVLSAGPPSLADFEIGSILSHRVFTQKQQQQQRIPGTEFHARLQIRSQLFGFLLKKADFCRFLDQIRQEVFPCTSPLRCLCTHRCSIRVF